MQPTVSVVIPTVGRPELRRALRSVADQTHLPLEVVVVDDGGGAPVDVPSVPGLEVVLLRTTGRCGAAAARNVGMRAARGDLVAFLDDDDVWIDDHLTTAVEVLTGRPEVDVYAGAALVKSTTQDRVEPTVVFAGRGRLLDHYYGRTSWARRRRRVLTPTLVFRRRVADLPMDESMRALEDLWWLFAVERAGHRIVQTASVGVVVHQDDERLATRSQLAAALMWADRLDQLRPGHGNNFLVGHLARTLARAGDRTAFDDLAASVAARGPVPADLRLVLALEGLLVRLRRGRG